MQQINLFMFNKINNEKNDINRPVYFTNNSFCLVKNIPAPNIIQISCVCYFINISTNSYS